MENIKINGKVYYGHNIEIKENKVFIDDKEIKDLEEKTIYINVEGELNSIKADACHEITIHGDCQKGVSTLSGSVKINGNVGGSVSTMSGSVHCEDVNGNINTMSGSIIRK